jgi:PPP family 3-phenylpropionic acid transporter
MATFITPRIFAPLLLGHIADKGKPCRLVKIASFLLLVTFTALSLSISFGMIAVFMFLVGFLFSGIIPQFEALTLNLLKNDSPKYSKIRLWGSVGFVLAVGITGFMLEQYSINILPWLVGAVILASSAVSILLPNHGISTNPHLRLKDFLLNRKVLIFLLVCSLQQASHSAYYIYFSIFLSDYGYNKTIIGLLWSFGVAAEIIMFLYLPKFINKINSFYLFSVALTLTVLRWLGTGFFADNMVLLFLIQALHAASFGLFHVVAVKYISSFFPSGMRSRAQSVYAISSFGLGSLIGSIAVSLTWSRFGGETVFAASGLLALLAFIIWRHNQRLYL